jgi:hypothetical protein
MYEMTLDMARLAEPPPEQAALFAAIATDQEASDHFLGMFAGTVSIPEFMSEANAARIMEQGMTTNAI